MCRQKDYELCVFSNWLYPQLSLIYLYPVRYTLEGALSGFLNNELH